jgi:ABC-type uncharacterized transport system permease subunit
MNCFATGFILQSINIGIEGDFVGGALIADVKVIILVTGNRSREEESVTLD